MKTIDKQTASFWRSVLYTSIVTAAAFIVAYVAYQLGYTVLVKATWFFALTFALLVLATLVGLWAVIVLVIWSTYFSQREKHNERKHKREINEELTKYRLDYMRDNKMLPPPPSDDSMEILFGGSQPVAQPSIDGSGSGSGSIDGSLGGSTLVQDKTAPKDSRSPKEKEQAVFEFYRDNPDATLDQGVVSLGMPPVTLSRYHDRLVGEGAINPFPKNR
jgi:ABC-type multidrug transport system fused ATPase/permease subunit